MARKTYKALKKVHVSGKTYEEGSTFTADSRAGQVVTALHFKQIAEAKNPPAKGKDEAKKDGDSGDAKTPPVK